VRNRIFGAIGVLWGGGILVSALLRGPSGSGAYAQGQMVGYIFGGLLFLVGGYNLVRRRSQ
jgi:hypothetical protein